MLVINQLVASMLWYRLATLVPPSIFVTALQKKLVDFFWGNRKHWVSAAVLSLPLEEGGQSLVCVRTQVAALRLRTLRRYMYVENPPRWHALATYFFRQGRCLRGVSRLPVAGVSRPALRGLPVFYRDVLRVRNLVVFSQSVVPRGEGDVVAAGVAGPHPVMVGVEERREPRVVQIELTPAPSDLLIGPRLRDISRPPAPHNLSCLSEMTSMPFCDARRRALYRMLLHILNLRAFVSRPDSPWRTVLPSEGGGRSPVGVLL